MRNVAAALLLVCLLCPPALAQDSSRWGVAGAFVPKWDTSGALKDFTTLIINEESLGLSGSEFRIGVTRGRHLSGDWGVSFVRRSIDDGAPLVVENGSGCNGASGPGGSIVLNCFDDVSELTADGQWIRGVEVNKFIAFATIRQRVQIGLNIAGGVGAGQGSFRAQLSRRSFRCTFPPGVQPMFTNNDPCTGGVRSNETTTVTGTATEPFTRVLAYEKNLIPLGKIEAAVAVIVTPRVKVRLSGGLNFPGTSTIGVTGLFFFGS